MSRASTHHPEPAYHLAEWLARVYEHHARPPARQRDVLVALAVHFVDWGSGQGYASIQGLAEFCRIGRSTVQRALRWAREARIVRRLSRGHRRGDGTVVASVWQLISESLGVNTPAVENGV